MAGRLAGKTTFRGAIERVVNSTKACDPRRMTRRDHRMAEKERACLE